MKIILCLNRDIHAALALNLLLPTLKYHQVKIILSDENVKGILVNIFGGIVRCDLIAEGILAAVKEVNMNVPVVVRLEGNNATLGADILNKSDLNVIAATSLTDAAKKIVAAIA